MELLYAAVLEDQEILKKYAPGARQEVETPEQIEYERE